MKWTIIIPTWQRATMLRSLLDGLARQTCREFEVIVVCDGEDAETRKLSGSSEYEFPLRWIFKDENRGLAAARNTGAAESRGDFLLFLDDDIDPDADLVRTHSETHAMAPEWPETVAFGRLVEARETPVRSKTDEFLQRAWEQSLTQVMPEGGASPGLTSIGSEAERSAWFGLNSSIGRELFARMDGFDERLRSDEELEFGLRLYRSGVQARYAPKAVIRHRGGKDQSAYYPRCWGLSGEFDVYRAREKGERSAQVEQLCDFADGSLARRALARASWATPETVLGVARVFEKLTNAAGTRWSFAAWARLRRVAEYWRAVKSTGIRERELCEMAGAPGRILLFHSISRPENALESSYYISPDRFRRFLSWLEMMEYRQVGPAEWLGEERPDRNVLLTFDDAYDDLCTELMPELVRRKLRPLVFVVVDCIGKTNLWDANQPVRSRKTLTLEQMREMQRAGVTFGSHSLTHPPLTALTDCDLRCEVRDSKAKLEDLLGMPVEWFGYPYGDADRRVRAAVAEAGYKAAVTTNGGLNRWQDPLALNRLEVSDEDSLMDFALKVATGRNYRRGMVNLIKRNIG
jgi:peptidoglycan/xylan/chitin deacetylase (PgdA/CDA1 family)/GT2 family glycosyltransferase